MQHAAYLHARLVQLPKHVALQDLDGGVPYNMKPKAAASQPDPKPRLSPPYIVPRVILQRILHTASKYKIGKLQKGGAGIQPILLIDLFGDGLLLANVMVGDLKRQKMLQADAGKTTMREG